MKTMLPSSGERGNITWTLCQDPPLPLHSPPHPHSLSHYPAEKTSENAQLRYIYRFNSSMLMIYTHMQLTAN